MIVYKIKDNKIAGIDNKGDNYILTLKVLLEDKSDVIRVAGDTPKVRDGETIIWEEYGSDVWYQKPSFTGTEIVETITQLEIDDQTIRVEKGDKITAFLNSDSTVWTGKTPDGTKDYAVVIGNDGKLSTIEII